jgi:hypothetical protein
MSCCMLYPGGQQLDQQITAVTTVVEQDQYSDTSNVQ